ncbi:dienelactone hydrolase family protein [Cryptosporangium phraense]|uniref:Alpha/beta hydrolase n=1 Tax=Cryptosporangium phraense TaxID=2593070 RepID=A0A545B0I2_9ACTN|nr:dienelactone hydrolase family protein [Cryptosporangium phraense]TQS47090.1 alpha/beta hydrolase [Cryptosporangium phraense]
MPDHLKPFVVKIVPVVASRRGALDFYYPDVDGPRPAVVFVHGGPLPSGVTPRPRDWPLFQGYGSLVSSQGLVAVVVEHGLTDPTRYPVAAADVAAAVDAVRADPRVDPSRIALWFFSGGGLLSADWLSSSAEWLRCVALSYPVVAVPPGWPVDERFRPVSAVRSAGALPIVLTRAGLEQPVVAEGVASFVAAAADVEVVEVPNGRHSFDVLDDTDESREAVHRAVAAVKARLVEE